MFIYNVKISSGKFFKLILLLMIILVLIITGVAIYRTVSEASKKASTDDVYIIPVTNYTNVLKAVHEDLDTYIGQKISFSGYVYRVYDLTENQFVLARDMVVSSDFQTIVVGFLCEMEDARNFEDGTWVNIVGEIKKGYYHGDIPVIELTSIEKTEKPNDTYVYPPDDYYIPTSTLLYSNPY